MAIILFAVFIDLVGFGLIVPILPFLTLKFGYSPLVGTALVAMYAVMTFVSGPFWGRLSDRIGRKKALAMTFFGGTLSYMTLAFADSIWLLFAARAMSGAMAGNVGIVMAAVADMTEPENRGKYMGYIGAAFGLGFAVGPGLGGLLAADGDDVSILLPGLIAAGLSFTAMVLTLFLMRETYKPSKAAEDTTPVPPWTEVLRGEGKVLLFVMFVIVAIGQSAHFSITPFWLEAVKGWTVSEVGLLLMAVGLMVALMQSSAIGPLFKAVGEVNALAIGTAVFIGASMMLVLGGGHTITVFVGFPLLMSGLTLAFPALNSLLSRSTDTRLQGTALGISNGMSALGRVIGPLLSGLLFTADTPSAPYVLIAAMGVIILIWALFLADRTEGDTDQSDPNLSAAADTSAGRDTA